MAGNIKTYPISYGSKTVYYTGDSSRVVFYAQAKKQEPLPNAGALIENALSAPISSPPLEQIVKAGDKVAILVDDITRPTPRQLLLAAVINRLSAVKDLQIQIVLALGTHRLMTKEEIERDLGGFSKNYPVININYMDEGRFAQVGRMPDGTLIRVYREILEADVLIGVGNIVPHIAAGWSGGAKIVMPGVCGKETTDAIHMLSCLKQNVLETCGHSENQFRCTMESLAQKVGLSFIINTVIDEQKNVLGVFCGHFVHAHRAGVAFAKEALCPKIPERAQILIVSANPAHSDFWQGAKPYVYAHFAVKQGGVMILLLEAGEGLCGCAPAHEQTLRSYYNKSEEEILLALQKGEVTDILGMGEAFIRLQTQGFCHTIVVSDGLTKEDAALLGFEMAPSLEAAIEKAHARMGPDATIGIIPQGGDILCRLENE